MTSLRLPRPVLVAGAVGVLMATVVVGVRWSSMQLPIDGHPYVGLYDPPAGRAEAMLVIGDGQAFAGLAQDPTLARPSVFRSTANDAAPGAEATYRAQRPVLGWLAWAGSLGQAGAVPIVMLGLTILSAGALVVVAAELARRQGRRVDLAPLVLLAPGSMVVLGWTGVEILATALGLAGALAWTERRRRWAVAFLVLAALSRETLLLVPMALAACELWSSRRPFSRAALVRVAPLAIPFVAWGGWVVVVHARLGFWPSDAGTARLGLPLGGVAGAIGQWGLLDVVVAVALWGLGTAACVRLGRPWSWIVGFHLLFASTLGVDVLRSWVDFSRVLLPVSVLGIVALLPVVRDRSSDVDEAGELHRPVTAPVGAARSR